MLFALGWGFVPPMYGQNCPNILQCPVLQQTICDPTENDSTFWNEDPYTFSNLRQSADLYEGIADLTMRAVACAGAEITVTYRIVMDLDNDLLGETVISSTNLPPPGIVFANNALNPNYSGGDTVWFDKRPVPASSRFRFAMETHLSNDTLRAYVRWNTPENPNQYLAPRMPEGQHTIFWTVVQNGITRNCQYSFRVTDCAAPTLFCGNNLIDDIGPNRSYTIFAAQFIDFVADNITSDDDLDISMRRAGAGTGFPVQNGNPVSQLTLDCSNLGTQPIEIWARDEHGISSHCNVSVQLTDSAYICTELPRVCARTYWDTTQVIEQVETIVNWVDTGSVIRTHILSELPDGCFNLDTFPAYPVYIAPYKSSDPLNGVTTFDLLLISKHVLAIEALDEPWKIIAADANANGSVTTNDVVQLRRLILGMIDQLPGNKSWRFFEEDCVFPPNPFNAPNCANGYNFDVMPFWAYPEEIRFYGLKMGDVNNSALANSTQSVPEDRSVKKVQLPDISLKAGEVMDIPLRMEQAGSWLGFQCSLPFDATKMEITDVIAGSRINPQEFASAQPEAGMLRISWFDVSPQTLLPDDNLLLLRVKALTPLRLRDVLAIPVEETVRAITSEMYTAENIAQALQFEFQAPANSLSGTQVFNPQPNPFTAGTSIPVRLERAGQVQVSAGNMEGKTLYSNTFDLSEGAHLLDIPATTFAEKGVYTWQVRAGAEVFQGKLVRL
ncbi:MAG: hypothetical protein IPL27_15640 [Lewinellaceae bacterium]|nr:hypothetical protein [Lewinellaceae bacterium]